jgi:hypothetical protein
MAWLHCSRRCLHMPLPSSTSSPSARRWNMQPTQLPQCHVVETQHTPCSTSVILTLSFVNLWKTGAGPGPSSGDRSLQEMVSTLQTRLHSIVATSKASFTERPDASPRVRANDWVRTRRTHEVHRAGRVFDYSSTHARQGERAPAHTQALTRTRRCFGGTSSSHQQATHGMPGCRRLRARVWVPGLFNSTPRTGDPRSSCTSASAVMREVPLASKRNVDSGCGS